MTFTRVLSANRGEIARRSPRGGRKLGRERVALICEADRDDRFVLQESESVVR